MSNNNLLFNTYEPSLTDGNWNTSMAAGFWLMCVFDYLKGRGINLHNVSVGEHQDRQDVFERAIDDIKTYDGGVFYLRWPMGGDPRYAQRQKAYVRQWQLIEALMEHGKPIMIFNGDLQSTG